MNEKRAYFIFDVVLVHGCTLKITKVMVQRILKRRRNCSTKHIYLYLFIYGLSIVYSCVSTNIFCKSRRIYRCLPLNERHPHSYFTWHFVTFFCSHFWCVFRFNEIRHCRHIKNICAIRFFSFKLCARFILYASLREKEYKNYLHTLFVCRIPYIVDRKLSTRLWQEKKTQCKYVTMCVSHSDGKVLEKNVHAHTPHHAYISKTKIKIK